MAFPVMHTNGTAGLAPSSNTTVGLLAQNGSTAVHKTLAEHDLDLSIYLWDPMSNREAVVEGEDVKDDGGMDGMHIEKRDHPPWDEKLTSAWDSEFHPACLFLLPFFFFLSLYFLVLGF